MRYKDGINVGFSRGLKGKWKKSRINQNSTAVVFFCGTSPLTMSWLRVRNSFFSNIFLYFSSLELFSLSLSLDSIFMCVRVFFFSKRSKVRPRLGQWSVAGLVSLLLAFFRTLRVILFFFYSPNSLGFFSPEFFPVPAVLMRPGWTFVKTLPWQPLMACPLRNAMELSGQYFDWRFQWRRWRLILRAFYGLCVESSGNVSRLWWSSKGLSVWFS